MMEGHNKDTQEHFEASRLGAYLSILPHIDSKKNSLTPQKLFPFYWEKETNQKPITEEGDLEYFDKLTEIINSGKLIPKDNGKSKN
jgi:hypothetical protein